MKSDDDMFEKLSAASNIHMPAHKQLEIWNHIEQEIRQIKPAKYRASIRLNSFKAMSCGIAALAIVAVGLYAVFSSDAYNVTQHQSRNTTGWYSTNSLNYSLFKNVPADRVTKIKTEIGQAGVQHFQLPTEFPYSVTSANIPGNGIPPHQIEIYLGNPTHALQIEAQEVQNTEANTSWITMQDEKETTLSDGTKALYGNNGFTSQLAWVKDHVFYQLLSSTPENKADLTEEQLIQVADSCR
jgi:hypothetical protein